jgi:RNA-dependent RNA polymerase
MISILAKGLDIGGNKSQIVNYSNSQLKSHSIWMMVKSNIPELQLDRIIGELGEFDLSEGPLKMYSRRGQCFTTTKYITKLEASEIKVIDDIKVQKTDDPEDPAGFYNFTDGCGNVSVELCRLMNERLKLYSCSAY